MALRISNAFCRSAGVDGFSFVKEVDGLMIWKRRMKANIKANNFRMSFLLVCFYFFCNRSAVSSFGGSICITTFKEDLYGLKEAVHKGTALRYFFDEHEKLSIDKGQLRIVN
jgi:hypothetical protein